MRIHTGCGEEGLFLVRGPKTHAASPSSLLKFSGGMEGRVGNPDWITRSSVLDLSTLGMIRGQKECLGKTEQGRVDWTSTQPRTLYTPSFSLRQKLEGSITGKNKEKVASRVSVLNI